MSSAAPVSSTTSAIRKNASVSRTMPLSASWFMASRRIMRSRSEMRRPSATMISVAKANLVDKEAEAKEARDRFVDAARPHATQEDAGELEIETEKA